MSQIINEELSRMFYLLDHKRGVVISEQDATIASPAAATTTTTAPDASTTTGTPQEYVVQKGDTLGKIGQCYDRLSAWLAQMTAPAETETPNEETKGE